MFSFVLHWHWYQWYIAIAVILATVHVIYNSSRKESSIDAILSLLSGMFLLIFEVYVLRCGGFWN